MWNYNFTRQKLLELGLGSFKSCERLNQPSRKSYQLSVLIFATWTSNPFKANPIWLMINFIFHLSVSRNHNQWHFFAITKSSNQIHFGHHWLKAHGPRNYRSIIFQEMCLGFVFVASRVLCYHIFVGLICFLFFSYFHTISLCILNLQAVSNQTFTFVNWSLNYIKSTN